MALRKRWFDNVLACAFLAAFVWLRWFSTFWQYRWTGLCLGVAFVLVFWPTRTRMQTHLDFTRKHGIPKRVDLIGGIAGIVFGGLALKDFLTGRSFFSFSGVRAASDSGLFTVIVLTAGFEAIFLFWLLARADRRPRSAITNTSHG